MDDLISRSKLIEFANNYFGGVIDCNDIARFPTIEAEPVRHGRWIMVRDRNNHPLGVKCSECGRRVKNSGENYCPKCG